MLLLQKVAAFEEPEENMDSEDGIKDVIRLIRVPTVLENPGKSWNILESPGISWKVLEFE